MNLNRLFIVHHFVVFIHIVNSKNLDWCSTATSSCGTSHVACNYNGVNILIISIANKIKVN